MAGLAKTESFMLNTASLMIGPMPDLMDLDTEHSVGLVKNLTFKSAPSFTDLSQGTKNTLVYSVMTGNEVTMDGEMYEYTAKNVSYASGLDGSTLVAAVDKNLPAEVTSTTTLTLDTLADATKFTGGADGVGDRIMVEVGSDDQVMIRRVSTVDTGTGVVTVDPALPAAYTTGLAVKLHRCNNVAIGSLADQPYMSCKVVGRLANGEPVVILVPKIRVVSGLSFAFKTDNFDHIPVSIKAFDLVTTDPFYTMFQKVGKEGQPAKAMLSSVQ